MESVAVVVAVVGRGGVLLECFDVRYDRCNSFWPAVYKVENVTVSFFLQVGR
jgi:hypothetical protein